MRIDFGDIASEAVVWCSKGKRGLALSGIHVGRWYCVLTDLQLLSLLKDRDALLSFRHHPQVWWDGNAIATFGLALGVHVCTLVGVTGITCDPLAVLGGPLYHFHTPGAAHEDQNIPLKDKAPRTDPISIVPQG